MEEESVLKRARTETQTATTFEEVPFDVVGVVLSFLDFDTFFFSCPLVCHKWSRCVQHMVRTPTRAFTAMSVKFLQDLAGTKKRKGCRENIWQGYQLRTSIIMPFATCRCGGQLVKTKCNHCAKVTCSCNSRNTEPFTCINVYCLMKRQFALNYDFCLCKFPDICKYRVERHVAAIFPF